MLNLLSFLFTLFLAMSSQADILFFDLNDSPEEVKAAKRAADKRGEKLLIYPSQTHASVVALKKMNAEYEAVVKKIKNCTNDSIVCKNLHTRKEKIDEGIRAEKKNLEKDFSVENTFSELKEKNVKLSSVIISGHAANGKFGGSIARLKQHELQEAVSKFSPVGDDVKSLLLWGCYTATPGSIEYKWKSTFPNLNVIAGFNGLGPAGENAASWTYLEDFLEKEKSMSEEADASKLNKMFQGIKNIDMTHSAACFGDTYLMSNKTPQSMKKIMQACAGIEDYTVSKNKKYKCYMDASFGCESPPINTGNSDLRQIYEHIQDTRHCVEKYLTENAETPVTDLIEPEQAIRLIQFRNILNNFSNLYDGEIQFLNRILRERGAPESLQLQRVDKMSRAVVLKKFDEIGRFLTEQETSLSDEPSDDEYKKSAELKLATFLSTSMSNSLYNLDSECVPDDWINPASVSKNECYWDYSQANIDRSIRRMKAKKESKNRFSN